MKKTKNVQQKIIELQKKREVALRKELEQWYSHFHQ